MAFIFFSAYEVPLNFLKNSFWCKFKKEKKKVKQQRYLAFSCISLVIAMSNLGSCSSFYCRPVSWKTSKNLFKSKNNSKQDRADVFYVKLCSSWGVQGVIVYCEQLPSLKTRCFIVGFFVDLQESQSSVSFNSFLWWNRCLGSWKGKVSNPVTKITDIISW